MIALLTAVVLATPPAAAVQAPVDAPDAQLLLGVELGGRAGGAAGNVLAAPFAAPGVGGGLTLDAELRLLDAWFLGADVGAALGQGSDGSTLPLAGYQGAVRGGGILDGGRARLRLDAHAGLTSIALLPVPRWGLGAALQLVVAEGAWCKFYGAGRLDLDLLVVVPAPAAEAAVGATLALGDALVVLEAGVEGDAVIALVANSVAAAAFATVSVRYAFR